MGIYYGVEAARPDSSRVLELGCGTGSNLLWQAYTYPNSEFVGIDFSEVEISFAKRTAEELGITNATFICEDIGKADTNKIGLFDFIVAHGLFSWVPESVREKILALYSECLSPNGIGYISYNAYPGCHIREMLWEPARFHVGEEMPPMRRVTEAINFLGALSNAEETEPLFRSIVKSELAAIAKRPPENFFHDELEDNNQPFYFSEFARRLASKDLQFLCEADRTTSYVGNLSPDVRDALEVLGTNVVRYEQYLDFIKCRRFRSTLVCRADIELNRHRPAEVLQKLFFTTRLRPVSKSPDIAGRSLERFAISKGTAIEIDHPLTKAALVRMGAVFPLRLDFAQLVKESSELIAGSNGYNIEDEILKMSSCLTELFLAGAVEFSATQPTPVTEVSEFPVSSAFVRWQIRNHSRSLANLLGENLEPVSELFTAVISLLDGSRNIQRIIDDISAAANVEEKDRQAFHDGLPAMIEMNLKMIAEEGLMIG